MMTTRAAAIVTFTLFTLCPPISALAQGNACSAAERELAYGEVAVENAKNAAGFAEAARQFQIATRKAPNCAAAFFNLGVAQEKAAQLATAKVAFEKYLQLAPSAPDAAQVRKLIYKLEYRIAKARQAPARPKASKYLTASALAQLSSGVWCRAHFFKNSKSGCGGALNVLINVSRDRLDLLLHYSDGGKVRYLGSVNGHAISGRVSWINSDPQFNCPDLLTFTGHIEPSGRAIVIKFRDPASFSHCVVNAWGKEQTYKLVRLR